jgi:hypothetical protein
VTAPALYKESITYQIFGELAFGNRGYLSEHKNPYIWTNKETTRYVNAELQVAQAALMGVGTVGAAVKIASIGWKSLKALDIGIMAGKALGDAIGQFGGDMLKGQAASQALANINLVSPILSGLGVDPLSSSALSSGINFKINGLSIEKNSENYFANAAIGTLFGTIGNGVNNLSQYKGLTIGVQMRTALPINPTAGTATAIGVNSVPTAVSSGISNSLTPNNP